MNRRKFLQGTAIASTGVLVSAPYVRAQSAVALKFSHTDQPGGARQKAAELFGQKIEQYTQGRYKLQIYPAGQLADDAKSVEQLHMGGLDFTVTGAGTYATHIPTMNLTALPFVLDSYEQGWKLYDEFEMDAGPVRQGPAIRIPVPFHLRSWVPQHVHEAAAGNAGRREGDEAAQLPERNDALDA